MIEGEFYGTRFRLCDDGTVYRLHKRTKRWNRIDNNEPNSDGYINVGLTKNRKEKRFLLHRILYHLHNPAWNIMNTSRDNCIDHIDGNPSNNHIDNLRVVTNQENNFNRTKAKGYYFNKASGKWKAQIKLNGKIKHIGYFENEEDARQAYVEAKLKLHIIKDRSNIYSKLEVDS